MAKTRVALGDPKLAKRTLRKPRTKPERLRDAWSDEPGLAGLVLPATRSGVSKVATGRPVHRSELVSVWRQRLLRLEHGDLGPGGSTGLVVQVALCLGQ